MNEQNVQRVTLQPSYILHSRDFRDSSVILDVITPTHGRVSLIAKGVKNSRSGARRALLQPFRSLLASWQGRGELCTLTTVEESGKPILLDGVYLICGYYINEIVQRLVSKGDSGAELFALYDETIRCLEDRQSPEPLLRRFEIKMLQLLGLAPEFSNCVYGNEPVDPQTSYSYVPDSGAIPIDDQQGLGGIPVSGETLIAMDSLDFSNEASRKEAKRLMRRVLAHFLGDKPVRSRELFHVYAHSFS